MAKRFDNEEVREIFLDAVCATGSFGKACKFIGITPKYVIEYRNDHPDFDQQCQTAKTHSTLLKTIRKNTKMRIDAMRLLNKRIEQENISNTTLLKIIEGFEPKS